MLTFIKESFVPTLIILAAAALVVLASIPLAQTDWAEGFRSGFGGEGTEQVTEVEAGEDEEAPPAAAMLVLPLVKVTLLMSIGGLLTALVLWIVRLISRWRRVPQGSG